MKSISDAQGRELRHHAKQYSMAQWLFLALWHAIPDIPKHATGHTPFCTPPHQRLEQPQGHPSSWRAICRKFLPVGALESSMKSIDDVGVAGVRGPAALAACGMEQTWFP